MDLHLRTDCVGEMPVLVVDGEVDLSTLPRLRNALARLVVDHPGARLAADISAVASLDDCGLGILMGAAAHARCAPAATWRCCAAASVCANASRLTGLDRAMIVADGAHARRSDLEPSSGAGAQIAARCCSGSPRT